MLWWEYADTAWVIIECGSVRNPRKALPELASHVTLTPEPILLPYRVRSLPRHYQVTSITEGPSEQPRPLRSLARNDYPEGIIQISIRYPAGLPMYAGQQFQLRYLVTPEADTPPSADPSRTATSAYAATSALPVPSTSGHSAAPGDD